MTVDDTARIAIVFKKLNEAKLRLNEAAKIYEHLLDNNSTPLDYGSMIKRNNGPLPEKAPVCEYIQAPSGECERCGD